MAKRESFNWDMDWKQVIPKFELDLAMGGAFEFEMRSAYHTQEEWDLLSTCEIQEDQSSKLLRFFLDPAAAHRSSLFLSEFLKIISKDVGGNINPAKVMVTLEPPLEGRDTKKYADIKIHDYKSKFNLLIENKIHNTSIQNKQQVPEEFKRARKMYGKNFLLVVLLPEESASGKILTELNKIPKWEQFVAFLSWNPDITDLIDNLLNNLSDDYTFQALKHFRHFCLEVGGREDEK